MIAAFLKYIGWTPCKWVSAESDYSTWTLAEIREKEYCDRILGKL